MSSVGPDGAILDDNGKPTGLRVKRNFPVNTPGDVGAAAKGFTNAGLKAEGNALDAGYAGAAQAVQHPLTAGGKIKMLIQKNMGPLAAQTGGDLAGAEAGSALALELGLAPESGGASLLPLLLGAGAAGVANIGAMKALPKEYGGDPEATKLNDFMWGAAPSAVGRAVPGAVGRFLSRKTAEGVAKGGTEFEKGIKAETKASRTAIGRAIQGRDITQADIQRVGQSLGAPTGYAEPAPEEEARTAAANAQRSYVFGPIDRRRDRLGEPIGEAYQALKGLPPIDPAKAQRIADAARDVQGNLISPAPKAKAVFEKLKSFAPQNGGPSNLSELLKANAQGAGDVGLTNEQWAALQSGQPPPSANPVTPDELRILRQELGAQMPKMQGGDLHAIKELRQAIDQELMPMLPPEIRAQHAEYHNFMQVYPVPSLKQLRKLGEPEQITKWMFGRTESVMNETIRNATPAERAGYQQMFAQHIMSDVNPSAPIAEQAKVLTAALEPYEQKGVLKALYGAKAAEMLHNFIYMPARRMALAKFLNSPRGKEIYAAGFAEEARRSGKAGRRAAEAGFQAWYSTLAPEQQELLNRMALPIKAPAKVPQLPSPKQALAEQLRPGSTKIYAPKFVLTSSIGGLAMGAMSGYTERSAIGIGVLMAGDVAISGAMRLGGADLIAKMYASPTGRAAGAAGFRFFVQLGSRLLNQAAQQPDDQDAADQ